MTKQINVDIKEPEPNETFYASQTTDVTISVTDNNGKIMLSCLLETLLLTHYRCFWSKVNQKAQRTVNELNIYKNMLHR